MNTPIYLSPGEHGFMGTFYAGNPVSDHAVIIVGGMGEKRDGPEHRAKMLASEGFNALALGWYNWKGLSRQAISIPVDYCENAVHWLMEDCPVKNVKVGMTGESYGAYYTLVCTSLIRGITCCIPMCGYDFIVEASKNILWRTHHAPFSYKGSDLPFAEAKALDHVLRTIRQFRKTPKL